MASTNFEEILVQLVLLHDCPVLRKNILAHANKADKVEALEEVRKHFVNQTCLDDKIYKVKLILKQLLY